MTVRRAAMRAMVILLGGVGGSIAAAPADAPPAARSFRVGTFELVALRDALNVVPNDGSVFGKDRTPAEVAAVLRAAGQPTDRLTLGVDALLVKAPGRILLIDTGLGPKAGGALAASLAAAGVAPAAVTDILITHSHGDHVGGLLNAAGDLAFPTAAIRMSAPEWTALKAQTGMAALVRAITPKVVAFRPGGTIAPGIVAVALPGHTAGHSGYEIRSGDARLIAIGDTAHSAVVSLAKPEWTIGYDGDAAAGKAQRRATLARLAETRALVFAPHFPFPGVGRIVANGDGFGWAPGLR